MPMTPPRSAIAQRLVRLVPRMVVDSLAPRVGHRNRLGQSADDPLHRRRHTAVREVDEETHCVYTFDQCDPERAEATVGPLEAAVADQVARVVPSAG